MCTCWCVHVSVHIIYIPNSILLTEDGEQHSDVIHSPVRHAFAPVCVCVLECACMLVPVMVIFVQPTHVAVLFLWKLPLKSILG